MAAGTGTAAVQIGLDIGLAKQQAGRAAVNHTANGRAVGFTKVGDCEEISKSIAAHGWDYPRQLQKTSNTSPNDATPMPAYKKANQVQISLTSLEAIVFLKKYLAHLIMQAPGLGKTGDRLHQIKTM